MKRENYSGGAEHRRQPADSAGRHQRHAWAPISGVRIDGVHLPDLASLSVGGTSRLGLAGHGKPRNSAQKALRAPVQERSQYGHVRRRRSH